MLKSVFAHYMKSRPIGIFDSGIGGLTVVRAIWKELPQESLIYLGDTARVPYGTRGKEVILHFALQLAKFLLKKKVKALVIACNTISSTCLYQIKSLASPIPVIDAISPAVEEAVRTTKTKTIGVIGTSATIRSGAYEKQIKKSDPKIKILTAACPLFVSLAEEGLSGHPATSLLAKEYLKPFLKTPVDTLILGCTHYPLLKKDIESAVNHQTTLIDSAEPIAKALKKILEEKNLLNQGSKPDYEFLVTDAPNRVFQIARRFFGGKLPKTVRNVSLED